MNKMNFKFTPIPCNFVYILDAQCLQVFIILLQKYNYWKNADRLTSDGFFQKSITEMSVELGNKNKKDIRAAISSLVENGIIEVKRGKTPTSALYFHMNFDRINELNEANDIHISKPSRSDNLNKHLVQPVPSLGTICTKHLVQPVPSLGTICTTTIDNTLDYNNKLKKENTLKGNVVGVEVEHVDACKIQEIGATLVNFKNKLKKVNSISTEENKTINNYINENNVIINQAASSSDLPKLRDCVVAKLSAIKVDD